MNIKCDQISHTSSYIIIMTNSITIELRLIMKLFRNTVLNGLNTLNNLS